MWRCGCGGVDVWRCRCVGCGGMDVYMCEVWMCGSVSVEVWIYVRCGVCSLGHTRPRVDQSASCIMLLEIWDLKLNTVQLFYLSFITSRAEISRFYPNKYLQVSLPEKIFLSLNAGLPGSGTR